MDYKIDYGRKIIGFYCYFFFSSVKGGYWSIRVVACREIIINTNLNWRNDRLVKHIIVMRSLPTQYFTYLLQRNNCITSTKDISV